VMSPLSGSCEAVEQKQKEKTDDVELHGKEKELLALFEVNPPDYETVRQLLLSGEIDVNAGDEDDSLLTELYSRYGHADPAYDYFTCDGVPLVKITRLLLELGLDIRRNSGRIGALALTVLTFNHVQDYILEVTRLLLDAGLDPEYLFEEDDEDLLEGVRFDAMLEFTESAGHEFYTYHATQEGRVHAMLMEAALGKLTRKTPLDEIHARTQEVLRGFAEHKNLPYL